MGSILTIKLRNKEDDRVIICNVDQAKKLCEEGWEVIAPESDEVQAKTIEDLEDADQLKAEEAADDKETADDKPEIISPDVSVADESPEVK